MRPSSVLKQFKKSFSLKPLDQFDLKCERMIYGMLEANDPHFKWIQLKTWPLLLKNRTHVKIT